MTEGQDDPFDEYSNLDKNNPEIGVGFSDKVLLTISIGGFIMMAFLIYNIILQRVKSADELEGNIGRNGHLIGENGEPLDYEEELLRCSNISNLNRAQRRARAKALMKRQRRVDGGVGGDHHHHDNDNDGNNHNRHNNNDDIGDNHHHHDDDDDDDDEQGHAQLLLSRKERQKAAKACERKERHFLEEERREEQRQAMIIAQEEKKKRLELEAEKAKEEKIRREQEQEKQQNEKLFQWKTFLFSPTNISEQQQTNSIISVEDWVQGLQQEGSNNIVCLKNLAQRFDVSLQTVKNRIRELIHDGRVNGILEEKQEVFIYLSHEHLLTLTSFVMKEKGEVSLRDVSCETIKVLNETS